MGATDPFSFPFAILHAEPFNWQQFSLYKKKQKKGFWD